MASLIPSNDAHLMMLEIVVNNVSVPWVYEHDQVVLKKTYVLFRMLRDKDALVYPKRRDYRPYRGSTSEEEKFYGGTSVVFCIPASFFEKEISSVNVELSVMKEAADDWNTKEYEKWRIEKFQNVGFVKVPVDDLLNSIREQIHKRNKLAKHLSDFYKRQIISRSTMGTYTLLEEEETNEENAVETNAKITFYIRISYLGKSIVTEIERLNSIPESFSARAELDEEEPYHSVEVISEDLDRGWWDGRFPRIFNCLLCRYKEQARKEATQRAEKTRRYI